MEETESYEIDGIDYGCPCKELERKAGFKVSDTWECYVSSVLKALHEIKRKIANAS